MRILGIAFSSLFIVSVAVAGTPTQARPAGKSTQQSADQSKGIRIIRGLRPDTPQQVSKRTPPLRKLKMNAVSWETQSMEKLTKIPQPPIRRDPYRVTVEGASAGANLSVYKKGPAKEIVPPNPEERAAQGVTPDGKRVPLSAAIRRRANRDYNRAVRKAIATARPEEKLFDVTAPGPSANQPTVVEKPELLPTNTQLVVRGNTQFGQKYPAAYGTVEGIPVQDTGWVNKRVEVRDGRGTWVENRSLTTGAPSEPAQIMKANLRMTPVLQRGDVTYAKLLSLAAFSPNSTVTITNLRLEGEGRGNDAVRTFKTNATGSGDVELPALRGDRFRVVVITPKDANKTGAETTLEVAVPEASKDGKYFADRYLPVE